jgi:hypothetical protein
MRPKTKPQLHFKPAESEATAEIVPVRHDTHVLHWKLLILTHRGHLFLVASLELRRWIILRWWWENVLVRRDTNTPH